MIHHAHKWAGLPPFFSWGGPGKVRINWQSHCKRIGTAAPKDQLYLYRWVDGLLMHFKTPNAFSKGAHLGFHVRTPSIRGSSPYHPAQKKKIHGVEGVNADTDTELNGQLRGCYGCVRLIVDFIILSLLKASTQAIVHMQELQGGSTFNARSV